MQVFGKTWKCLGLSLVMMAAAVMPVWAAEQPAAGVSDLENTYNSFSVNTTLPIRKIT